MLNHQCAKLCLRLEKHERRLWNECWSSRWWYWRELKGVPPARTPAPGRELFIHQAKDSGCFTSHGWVSENKGSKGPHGGGPPAEPLGFGLRWTCRLLYIRKKETSEFEDWFWRWTWIIIGIGQSEIPLIIDKAKGASQSKMLIDPTRWCFCKKKTIN